MRTDKHVHNYEAGLLLGPIVMWTPKGSAHMP